MNLHFIKKAYISNTKNEFCEKYYEHTHPICKEALGTLTLVEIPLLTKAEGVKAAAVAKTVERARVVNFMIVVEWLATENGHILVV